MFLMNVTYHLLFSLAEHTELHDGEVADQLHRPMDLCI
jgi:hypothetical protein